MTTFMLGAVPAVHWVAANAFTICFNKLVTVRITIKEQRAEMNAV
jgi:hypothetical protein